MRMQLEIVDDLVEIRHLGNLAKFLNCLKNTVLRRLKELGYRTTRPPTMPLKGSELQNVLLIVSVTVHLLMNL